MALTARDIMQRQVVTVGTADPLVSVQRLFADEDIHGAPVVDDQNRVVGLISTTDLLRAAADARDAVRPELGYDPDGDEGTPVDFREDLAVRLGSATAADAMTPTLVTVAADATVPSIAKALCSNRVHRVLVMDRGELCGLISDFDLIALLEKHWDE